MRNSSQSITDRIKELEASGIRINHFLGRKFIANIETYFKNDDYTTEGVYGFYQNPKTGILIAIEEDGNFRNGTLLYAFLTRDGSVLPDPECVGLIQGNYNQLKHCRRKLIMGFT